MTNKIKTYAVLFLTILSVAVFSCKKDKEETYTYMKEGKIIGMDNRTCICCGGTEIIIDDVANPNGCSYFLAAQFPDGFTINEKETFPITIKMDWAVDSLHCFGNYIAITKIERK